MNFTGNPHLSEDRMLQVMLDMDVGGPLIQVGPLMLISFFHKEACSLQQREEINYVGSPTYRESTRYMRLVAGSLCDT